MKTLFVLGTILSLTFASRYRFDYEFNEQARGWLKFHIVPATWDEARLRCHESYYINIIIAKVCVCHPCIALVYGTKISNYKIYEETEVHAYGQITVFSGVHSIFSKGDYSSIEGVPLSRLSISWAPGEPDNYDNSESCLTMTSNGDMADVRCNNVLPYVCYKKFTQLAITSCGTIDQEYHLEARTGSCYKFHKRGLIWSEVYMTCMAEGGYLAVINDDKEAAVIKEIFSKHSGNTIESKFGGSLAVGFHDWGHHATSFMSIHGESLQDLYNTWTSGQPDNSTNARVGDPGQICGCVFRNGQMDDVWCNVPLAFLCEKDPKSLL